MPKTNDSLAQMISAIDHSLAKLGVELHLRPFRAATFFVKHMLVSIDEEPVDKNNFYEEIWFAGIYKEIHAWYEKKYGDLHRDDKKGATALFVRSGLPHVIKIPKTVSTRLADGTARISFPSKVYNNEKPLSWLTPKIKSKSLSHRDKLRAIARTTALANRLRTIDLNIGSSGDNLPEMASSIIDHLSQVAKLACAPPAPQNSLALWELHLATEKSIKCLLAQNKTKYPNTHDLNKLCGLLPNGDEFKKISKLSARMASHNKVISHRYLEEKKIGALELYKHYKTSIKICFACSSMYRKKVGLHDASFIIQQPPWMSQVNMS